MRRVLLYTMFLPAVTVGLSAQSQEIRLVAEENNFPYSADIRNQASGLSVELIRAAFRASKTKVNFVTMPYARCRRLLMTGHETGCFNASKDATTLPLYRFSERPLFNARVSIYARTNPSVSSNPLTNKGQPVQLSDLLGKRIGLTNGYTYGDAIEKTPGFIKDRSDDDYSNLKKLALGRVEFALVYEQVGRYLVSAHPHELANRIHQVGTALEIPVYISFSQSNPMARLAKARFDQGFATIRRNGEYHRLMKRWANTSVKPVTALAMN